MRTTREARGLGQRDAAKVLDCTSVKISHLETRRTNFRLLELSALCDLYGVPTAERPTLLAACERSRQRAWWDDEDVPDWLAEYLGLEDGALTLRGFALQLIPGLLQTPDYASAIMRAALRSEEADARTEVRLRRQALLARQPPLTVNYVIDEGALRRLVGNQDIMAAQLDHLVALGEQPNITVQVLPLDAGYIFDGKGEPVLLTLPGDLRVVYLEGLRRAELLDDPDDVDEHLDAWRELQCAALPEVESRGFVTHLVKDLQ